MDSTSAVGLLAQAKEVDGVNLLSAPAGASLRAELEHMYQTDYILSKAEAARIQMLSGYDVHSKSTQIRPSCHWELAVMRQMIRRSYLSFAKPETTRLKTLVVASAHREIAAYWKNKHVDFYVHGKETKDQDRVMLKMIEAVKDEVAKKAVIMPGAPPEKICPTKKRAYMTISDLEELAAVYQGTMDGDVGNRRIHLKIPEHKKYDVLLIEDGHYNFSRRDWLDLFAKTGATKAHVVGIFPFDQLFPDGPKPTVYNIVEREAEKPFGVYELVRAAGVLLELHSLGRSGVEWIVTMLAVAIAAELRLTPRRRAREIAKTLLSVLSKCRGYAGALGVEAWHKRSLVAASFLAEYIERQMTPTELVMTYGAHSNGYIHDRDAMMCLLDSPVINDMAYGFALHTEIVQRVGPMAYATVTVADLSDRAVRTIGIGANNQYVKVLDLIGSYDFANKTLRAPIYLTMHRREFFDVVNFLSSQKPEVVSVQLAMTMIRRASAGLSLGKTTLTPSWRTSDDELFRMAVTTTVVALQRNEEALEAIDPANVKLVQGQAARWHRFMAGLLVAGAIVCTLGIAVPVLALMSWFSTITIPHPLYELGVDEVTQEDGNPAWTSWAKTHGIQRSASRFEIEQEIRYASEILPPIEKTCDFIKLLGDVGKQDPICMHARGCEPTRVQLGMSASDVAQLRAELVIARDAATAGLRDVLDALVDKLEEDRNGFQFEASVELVSGPPGVGKSYTMRNMMDVLTKQGKAVAVHAPFAKLAPDYTVESNGKGPFPFYTQHKLFRVGKLNVMVVEEYTNMDERLIQYMAYKTGAQMVVMIGDEKQTGLMPDEGERPFLNGGALRMDEVREHVLPINFRSDPYTVALLNAECGYCLYAANDKPLKPVIRPTSELATDKSAVMVFSKASGQELQQEVGLENTVRKNQGQTLTGTHIYLRDGDERMVRNDALFAVAVSRHKVGTELTVYADTSEVEGAMRNRLRLDDANFQENVMRLARPDYRAHYERIRAERFGPDVPLEATRWDEILVGAGLAKVVEDKPVDTEWIEELYARVSELAVYVEPEEKKPVLHVGDQCEIQLLKSKYPKVEWCALDAMTARKIGGTHMRGIDLKLAAQFVNDFKHKIGKIPVHQVIWWLRRHGIQHLVCQGTTGRIEGDWDMRKVVRNDDGSFPFAWLIEITGEHAYAMSDWLLRELYKPRWGTLLGNRIRYVPFDTVAIAASRNGMSGVPEGLKQVIMWNFFHTRMLGAPSGQMLFCKHQNPKYECSDCPKIGGIGLFGPDEIVVDRTGVDMRNDLAIALTDDTNFTEGGYRTIERGHAYREEFFPERELPASVDAHLFADLIDPTVGAEIRTNAVGAAIGPSRKSRLFMKLNRDALYVRLDKKKRPLPDYETHIAFAGGFGNTQTTAAQEILGAAERYLVKPTGGRASVEGRRYATAMAERHYREWYNPGTLPQDMLDGIQRDFETAAKTRSYDVRALGSELVGTIRNMVTFTNKKQFKANKNNDPASKFAKVGQGISATSSATNLKWGPIFRQVSHAASAFSKDNHIVDCYMDHDTLAEKVREQAALMPDCASVVTTDVEQMDSKQNWFTARAEARLNSLLIGHHDQFEEYVETIRTNYPVSSPGLFTATVKEAKPSGAPDTLDGNNKTSDMMTEQVIVGRGPRFKVIKGDDNSRFQFGQKICRLAVRKLRAYSPLTMTIQAGDTQFTGLTMTKQGLFDNLLHTAYKILARPSRDYRSWAEYQVSLRDKLMQVRKKGVDECLVATVLSTGCMLETAVVAYGILQSACHINEKQWRDATSSISVNYPAGCDASGVPQPW